MASPWRECFTVPATTRMSLSENFVPLVTKLRLGHALVPEALLRQRRNRGGVWPLFASRFASRSQS